MEKLINKYAKNDGKVDFKITEELIADVDQKAEALKNEILNTETNITVSGTSYYVSQKGDDQNDGLSPQTAWKTINKVNEAPLQEGDAVLFERGGFFRGTVICKPDITYSAYGQGQKPILTSSPEDGSGSEKWSLVEGTDNIWTYYKELPAIGLIVFNGGENYSVLKVPSFVNGKYVLRLERNIDFDIKKHMHRDLAHFSELKDLKENGVPFVTSDHTAPLYLRCDKGNPGEIFSSIEFCTRDHGFMVSGCRNVKVDNLQISYVGGHGVSAGTCKGLTVTNCHFSWIGGSIQRFNDGDDEKSGSVVRFGNAIQIYGGCTDFTCEHNYISQVYDAGITHQYGSNGTKDCKQRDVKYINNLIEYCTYSIECFLSARSVGYVILYMRNILIENNIMRYSGFGFGEQRPQYDAPAAHIKGWERLNPLDENFVIRNNIFDRGRNMLIHVGAKKENWVPTLDSNIYIQYLEEGLSSLGRYGKAPTTVIPYTANVREVMNEMNLDKNAGVYFRERDELYDLPDFMPIKD